MSERFASAAPRWLRDLGVVSVRPRERFREILARGDARILPLFCAAAISLLVRDVRFASTRDAFMALSAARVALVVAGVICGIALTVGLLYLFAGLILLVGRAMEGSGTYRDVRLALGCGLAPSILALAFRVPLIFLLPSYAPLRAGDRARSFFISPGAVTTGCGVALLLALLQVAIFAWDVYVTSNTIAEAHRVPALRGLAILAILMAAPIVIALAAVLSSR